MSFQIALSWTLPLAVAIAAFGCALGLAHAIGEALQAIGRQPEASNKIQTAMIIGCAFIEALTIYALLTMLILQGKIGA